MFTSVLIANRGEIACRIARTARAARACAPSRSIPRPMPTRCTCGNATRRIRSVPRRRAKAISSIDRLIEVARKAGAQCIHPGYGFLSENAEFAEACAAGRHRVRRPAAGGDPRHGAEGSRQGADGEGRRAGGARLSRRAAGAGVPQAEGLRDRLSGADQGGRRRRRQGHAPRRQARRFRRGARRRAARGAELVRRRARADREIRRRAAPHRDAGVRRRARQRHPSQRARLLAAAPPPEGDRGGAGAGHDARSCAPRWARPRSKAAQGGRLCRRRHGRVHRRRRERAAARRLLVHGDEHAAAGRASGDRGDHRARSGRMAVPRRGGRDAAADAGAGAAAAATRSRRGSMPRIPARGFLPSTGTLLALQFPEARACASIPASSRAARSRRTTIR